ARAAGDEADALEAASGGTATAAVGMAGAECGERPDRAETREKGHANAAAVDRILARDVLRPARTMMRQMPTVSVIMSVYNAQRYLAAAIDSILAQTFTDFEFIIIDDGSTDRSPRILADFAAKDSRIRVETRANKGLTRSLNEAIGLSRGEFIARMDADDIAMPDHLQTQVNFLRAHSDVVLLGGGYELIDGAGRLLTKIIPPGDDATLQEYALSGRTPICHPLAMMRHDAVNRVAGYDESLAVAQDLDLWLKLGEIGNLACVPDILLRYRQHPQSVSEKKQSLQVQNMRLACERAC